MASLRNKKILLTGASGFIGERLLKALQEKGAQVTVLSRRAKSINACNIVKGDLCSKKGLERIAKRHRFDTIIHTAAFVPKKGKENNSLKNIEVNLAGTMNLFEAFKKKAKVFIFASTLEVYGKPPCVPVKETAPKQPQNLYALSKALAEEFLEFACKGSGVKLVILRYSNVFGPGERIRRAIPNFIKSAINGSPPVIEGDGSDERDYLYVDDAVDATILAAEKRRAGIFNVASGKGTSISGIAEKIIRLSGKKLKPKFVPRRKEKTRIILDISKASGELSFRPKTGIEEGLKEEIEWFRGGGKKEKCIVFDLDGTLLDYGARFHATYRDALKKHGFACPGAAKIFGWRKKMATQQEILYRILPKKIKQRKKLMSKIIRERKRIIEAPRYLRLDRPFPGVLKKIRGLAKEYDLFVLTLRQKHPDSEKQLAKLFKPGMFREVFTSGKEGHAFKERKIREIAREYRICTLVSDVGKDIESGKKAGIRTVAVLSGVDGIEELKKRKPDKIIGSVLEI